MTPAVFTRERWRWVPGYRGRYMVSSFGRVYSSGNAKRPRPRMLTAVMSGEYRAVTLYSGLPGRTSGRKVKVARLVLLAFRGPPPEGRNDSCHRNGNPTDDRLGNLKWGSRQDNVDDSRQHGTLPAGRRNGHAKLTEDDVLAIRRRRRAGEKGDDLALEYHVSRATISSVLHGKRWSQV